MIVTLTLYNAGLNQCKLNAEILRKYMKLKLFYCIMHFLIDVTFISFKVSLYVCMYVK